MRSYDVLVTRTHASGLAVHRSRAFDLAAIGLIAIGLGVAVYALARPQAATFLPAGWHRHLVFGRPATVIGSLPTFVHALAIPLLMVAVIAARRRAVVGAICASWCAVEIAFELAQHRAIRQALLEFLSAESFRTRAFMPIAEFVRTGTFDRFDIAAAVLGATAAYATAVFASNAGPGETTHAH